MVPQTKVFVGSLAQGSKPEELRKLFERFGVVTECDIMNRCGFVHMETEDQAAAAIRALHNSTFNGGVITVERGRIKDRNQRGPGGPPGRGGARGGMRGGERRPGGGPMRGGPMGGRDAPYMRDSRGPGGGQRDMRGPMGGGMMRNGGGMGGGYDRGFDRAAGGGGYEDRYGGYGEDRRGFALMDDRGRADPYAAPMYPDERRGYGEPYYSGAAPIDDMAGMYPDERRAAPMYPDERDIMERRPPMGRGPMSMSSGYDRAPPRAAGMGNGDMFSRRSPMRGGVAAGGYERDPYAQQYAPAPRGGGGARGGRDGGGMGPRRY